jgi:hypothetical protein
MRTNRDFAEALAWPWPEPEAEIAHVLRVPAGTVKSLLSRSMTKLKGALSDD